MDWVVFDYAGVISHPPTEEASTLLAQTLGVGPERFWQAYWKGREAYDRGAVDAAGYWGEVCWLLGRTANAQLLDVLVAHDLAAWMSLNQDTLQILQDLNDGGIPLAVLSNAPVELARLIDEQPWAALFEYRFFSADLQRAKPDPLVFRHVCEQLGAQPSAILFIDDRQENVDAALAGGMDSLLFTTAARLRADLNPVLPARSAIRGRRAAR